jgi:release factor glutamine methyltransferase
VTPADTAGAAVAAAAAALAAAGIGDARFEARLLVAHALGCDVAMLIGHPERPLHVAERNRIEALVRRRAAREPHAHIVGRREFWSLPLTVSRDTLIPRPESETIVEAVLGRVTSRRSALRILDLGTGSGCLMLALLAELPAAVGVGVDRSPAALAVARANARALGFDGRASFVGGIWDDALSARFDVVVANPPYLADDAIAGLAPDVARFEPRLALSGGPDGLDAYRVLLPRLRRLMTADGIGALEFGAGQRDPVVAMAMASGLQVSDIKKDLCGVPRVVTVRPAPSRSKKKSLETNAIPTSVAGS